MKEVSYCRPRSNDCQVIPTEHWYIMDVYDQMMILNLAIGHMIESVEPCHDGMDLQYVMITLDNGQRILITPRCVDSNGTDISDSASIDIEYDGIGSTFKTKEEILDKLGPEFLPLKERETR